MVISRSFVSSRRPVLHNHTMTRKGDIVKLFFAFSSKTKNVYMAYSFLFFGMHRVEDFSL
ncbi:hypothetical protein TSO5_15975 [Azospirillum sp. TSO5]|nr:hypothetical protein TSO5_15975 [Azospirillum sp. TSO5]